MDQHNEPLLGATGAAIEFGVLVLQPVDIPFIKAPSVDGGFMKRTTLIALTNRSSDTPKPLTRHR